jgi:hypothetical protein
VLLLTRPDCPLCEEFLEELGHEFPVLAARVQAEDVDSREDWRSQYGQRIPVLLGEDGSVWCEGHLDVAAVAERLGGATNTGI